ncbi:uncharacterized protein PSANT_07056 [Moesziomyces antarcticus]|uniref:Uncharacterized protein n=1 Tax=Pseudozyma antarctica TaxID=84753 RepID=A0A5C3FHT9_PSEA2|nr:uncharacterized protein PSANT_00643 [Moesziomyces antarcticus]SPO49363.1 uncharacterized protein PSANT_07056 [Moesziomyces antarcticus]
MVERAPSNEAAWQRVDRRRGAALEGTDGGVLGGHATCTAERVWRSHWAHGDAGAGMKRFEAASVEQGLLADGTQSAPGGGGEERARGARQRFLEADCMRAIERPSADFFHRESASLDERRGVKRHRGTEARRPRG